MKRKIWLSCLSMGVLSFERDAILTALENAGVDNWSGYSNAIAEIYNEGNVA
ncbi:RecBCD nuclease inhibitor [Photobacterium malacitanum]|uniref:RecBCD nuclease inhibitor n=1 Tax=Photobacterium malacitanum TaxID=2204294 RepID=UPI0011867601